MFEVLKTDKLAPARPLPELWSRPPTRANKPEFRRKAIAICNCSTSARAHRQTKDREEERERDNAQPLDQQGTLHNPLHNQTYPGWWEVP